MVTTGSVLVALAAICWGVSGGLGGILIAQGWDALVVAFYRSVIGLVIVLAWLVLRPRNSGMVFPRLWLWASLAGLGVAGNFGFYFVSIAEGSVAVSATLMYCAPIFVCLVSFALRLEQSTWLKWVGIIVAMIGITLLTRIYNIGAGGITSLSIGAGLFSGMSYALFIFSFKNAESHGSPQAVLVIAFTVVVGILFWSSDADQPLAVMGPRSWALLAALGVFGGGLSFMLYIVGLRQTTPVVASIVAMVEPVTASLFGIMVLHERLTGLQFLGMGLILLTVTSMSIHSNTRRTSS